MHVDILAPSQKIDVQEKSYAQRLWQGVTNNVTLIAGVVVVSFVTLAILLQRAQMAKKICAANLKEQSEELQTSAENVHDVQQRILGVNQIIQPVDRNEAKLQEQSKELQTSAENVQEVQQRILGVNQHSQKEVASQISLSEIGGLQNGGQTCYMAGVIQALFAIPGFYERYVNGVDAETLQARADESGEDFSLRESLDTLHLITRSQTTVPASEMKSIRDLHQRLGWKREERLGSEDAQEYAEFLFKHLKIPNFSCWKLPFKDNEDSEGLMHFTDSFYRVHLRPDQNSVDFSDLVLNEIAFEGSLNALRMLPDELPAIFPIHLKRYAWANNEGQKRDVSIRVSERLDLPLAHPESQTACYSLCSCVVHEGSAEGGHYYSYAKQGAHWIKFDDESVKIVPSGEALASIEKNGYLFFYKLER